MMSCSITENPCVSDTAHAVYNSMLIDEFCNAGTLDDIEYCLGAVGGGGGGGVKEGEVWSLVRHLKRRDMMVLLRSHGVMKKVVDIISRCPSKEYATNFALCCLACLLFKDLR